MTFEIIWCNPVIPSRTEKKVRRVSVEESGALYAVTSADVTTELELIRGSAA